LRVLYAFAHFASQQFPVSFSLCRLFMRVASVLAHADLLQVLRRTALRAAGVSRVLLLLIATNASAFSGNAAGVATLYMRGWNTWHTARVFMPATLTLRCAHSPPPLAAPVIRHELITVGAHKGARAASQPRAPLLRFASSWLRCLPRNALHAQRLDAIRLASQRRQRSLARDGRTRHSSLAPPRGPHYSGHARFAQARTRVDASRPPSNVDGRTGRIRCAPWNINAYALDIAHRGTFRHAWWNIFDNSRTTRASLSPSIMPHSRHSYCSAPLRAFGWRLVHAGTRGTSSAGRAGALHCAAHAMVLSLLRGGGYARERHACARLPLFRGVDALTLLDLICCRARACARHSKLSRGTALAWALSLTRAGMSHA